MKRRNTPTKTEVRTLTPLTLLVLSATPRVIYLDDEPGVRRQDGDREPLPAASTSQDDPRLPESTSGAARS